MSGEESQDTDCELPEEHNSGGAVVEVAAQATSSPVTSLPDVVTASHVQAANQVQSSNIQENQPISQSASHPESLSLALSSSQPASPQKHLVVASGSTPSSPQRQPANSIQGPPVGSPLRNQPKGQIGFTIDFDDTGVSWNLKSDLNQFLPSSRKLRMEGRRSAAKDFLPSRKHHATRSLSPRERQSMDKDEPEADAQPCNDKDDLLSEAGTYIIDNVPASKPQLTVPPKPRPKNLRGDYIELNDSSILQTQKFVDIETHDFTIGQSSLMESFLDHAAAAAAVNVSTETLGNSRLNVNEIDKMAAEAITPVASDDEKDQVSEKQSRNNFNLNSETGADKYATFSRGRKTVSVQPRMRATAIPCRSNDVTPAKEQSKDLFEKASKQMSERSKSPQYTSSLTSSSIVSSKVSSANKETMDSSKDNTSDKKSEKTKGESRNISNLAIRRPSSANAGKLKSAKVDVDKRLVDMEEALKKTMKVSLGTKVLAQYNTDNSSPARATPLQPKTTGNFTRATPIRRSAGPILSGSKQKASDINSLSSGSDVFDDKKAAVPPAKPLASNTRSLGPPPSPTASVRMNKAMKLRMKKFSDCDDMDCLSMTSDGASSKSMSNSKKLTTFSRANPLYKSLPANRGSGVGTPGNQTSRAAMAAKVVKPVILPNKTTIGGSAKTGNISSATHRNTAKLQVHNKPGDTGLRTNSSGSRTPDETNLSTFDKLVLSSIDQLSKKLNINSSLLVNLCQQHDSQLTGLTDLTNIGAKSDKGIRNTKGENGGCDIPKLKTGCQEISAILYELRVVEKNIDHVTRHLNTVTSNKCNDTFSQSLDNSFNSGGGANNDMCDLVEYF